LEVFVVDLRRGQGLFKQRVMQIKGRCRITGVEKPIGEWPAVLT
jgi:hypothetical protein